MGGLTLRGAIPANLLPFHPDYSIDEVAYRRHLRWLADVDGVETIVVNGHAAEVSSLTRDERRRALAIAADEVGDRVQLVAGIFTDGSLEAAELARDARDEGMAGVLVLPPACFQWGANLRPEMALAHFGTIAERVGIPMIVFQYPVANGWGYSTEVLLRLIEIPTVVGIKEWSQDIVVFERNLRSVRAQRPDVAILSSFSASLYASLELGADGLISGMGSVVADLQAQLFAAVQARDVNTARALNDRLYPLASAFYAPPFVDMHNRMKEALVLLGRLERAVVRPPLVRITDAERARIAEALRQAGLLAAAPALAAR
jgi:4-hydroxy-tetrahydrodipicolinate synthase